MMSDEVRVEINVEAHPRTEHVVIPRESGTP